jgi:large subunit ribosomal protein L15
MPAPAVFTRSGSRAARRLPKRGFRSPLKGDTAQVRLGELGKLDAAVIDLAALKAANIVPAEAKRAKVFLSGKLDKAVTLRGIAVTQGAAAAITQAGGTVES